MPECIHGFDDGLCDICFPRRAPERPRTPRPPRRESRPAAVRPVRATAAPAAPGADIDLAGARVFHITHLRNLELILRHRELRARGLLEGSHDVASSLAHDDAAAVGSELAPQLPSSGLAVDVSSELARHSRASLETPAGTRVCDHVAFYLSAHATRWRELRAGAAGPHWSDAARAAHPHDFVVLSLPVSALGDPDAPLIVTDLDAASEAARFAVGATAAQTLLRRARSAALMAAHAGELAPGGTGGPSFGRSGPAGAARLDAAGPDAASPGAVGPGFAGPGAAGLSDAGLLDAELLAGARVPLSAIALIGVANEPARDAVRTLISDAGLAPGTTPKIAVYPPWFVRE